jgi:hypothetical protein
MNFLFRLQKFCKILKYIKITVFRAVSPRHRGKLPVLEQDQYRSTINVNELLNFYKNILTPTEHSQTF